MSETDNPNIIKEALEYSMGALGWRTDTSAAKAKRLIDAALALIEKGEVVTYGAWSSDRVLPFNKSVLVIPLEQEQSE